MNNDHKSLNYLQFSRDGTRVIQGNIAIESPLTLSVNGKVFVTFQCTPAKSEALAIGFLYNEGYIQAMSEVKSIYPCENNDHIDVWLDHPIQATSALHRTSGCYGGLGPIHILQNNSFPVSLEVWMSPEHIFTLIDEFLNNQLPHSESGGVHTSAIADGTKQLFQISDIGRHNTIDKIAGQILLNNIEVQTPVLLTTGRISSEIVQKSVRLRSTFLISLRSASQAGINLAEQHGITLIGNSRRGRFNLLSHPERIHSDQIIS